MLDIYKKMCRYKGIDDLLANSLKDHENELAEDIEFACNAKKGLGKYVEMFKVTTLTDHKMLELWCLHSNEAFSERHKDVLKNLPEFVFGRYRWKFDDTGKLVLAQPFDDDEKFWEEVDKETRSGIKPSISFAMSIPTTFFRTGDSGVYDVWIKLISSFI